VRKARPRTRAALLSCGERETILSRRAYRQDAVATVALWARAAAHWTLHELAEALRRPAFVLYAGRKASALGMPLAPVVRSAATLADALVEYGATRGALDGAPSSSRTAVASVWSRLRPPGGWGREVSHDHIRPGDDFASGLESYRRDVRRDVPTHRSRWQFAERVVAVGLLDAERANPGGAP
jgi:CRISPR system Cascade subunit CasD